MNQSQFDLLLQYIDAVVEHSAQLFGSAPGSTWSSEAHVKALKDKLHSAMVDAEPEARG